MEEWEGWYGGRGKGGVKEGEGWYEGRGRVV